MTKPVTALVREKQLRYVFDDAYSHKICVQVDRYLRGEVLEAVSTNVQQKVWGQGYFEIKWLRLP